MTRRLLLLGIFLGLSAGTAFSQVGLVRDSETKLVRQAVKIFFDGFAKQDTSLMMMVTEPGTRLVVTSFSEYDEPVVRPISMEEFLAFIARPQEEKIVETYRNEKVVLHDNLATVWMDYNLWIGDRIDHCGKDSFQLAKDPGGWKIIAIADTQRKTGCEPFDKK